MEVSKICNTCTGDVAMAAIEEERNAIILCMPNAKECLCRRLHHFTTDVDSAGKDVEEN